MFGRSKDQSPAQPEPEAVDESHDPRSPKGRPTPSRKEAEAARERDRDARATARAGMMAGDERYLPARDKGPARAFTRDFVDSRFTVAEFFIFVAVAVLVLGFIRNQAVQSVVSLAFFAFTAVIAVDTAILLFTLNRRAAAAFPDKADRKGITLYATLRALQLRRLRMPPPRVRRGGRPIA